MYTKQMLLTNEEIYGYSLDLVKVFEEERILPVAVNFVIQKNKKILLEIAQEIESARSEIIARYATEIDENERAYIPEDKVEEATSELNQLLNIQQELKLYVFNLEDLGSTELTAGEMKAILFMIED